MFWFYDNKFLILIQAVPLVLWYLWANGVGSGGAERLPDVGGVGLKMVSRVWLIVGIWIGYFMSEAGCTGIVAGIIANIGIYIVVFGFELSYLGPLWILPGLVCGLIGGIVGNHLNRTSKWRGIMGGALGAAIAFGCMYFTLLALY